MGEICSIIFVNFEQNLPKKPILPKKHENSTYVL